MRIAAPFLRPAWWQSGYVADCKSVNAGSIPAQASTPRVRNCPPCLQEDALPKHRPFAHLIDKNEKTGKAQSADYRKT